MTIRGERELQRLAREVLTAVDAGQAEVVVSNGTSALTRFANNYIHQNVQESDPSVSRARRDRQEDRRRRLGRCDAGRAARAWPCALLSWPGCRSPTKTSSRCPARHPRRRSMPSSSAPRPTAPSSAPTSCARSARPRWPPSWSPPAPFAPQMSEMAVMNSLGVWAYHRDTSADINTVVMGETVQRPRRAPDPGCSRDRRRGAGAEAIDKALRGVNPRST